MSELVNLCKKFLMFSDHWSAKIVGELNGQLVKLAKLKGEFVWHDHADEDEMFLVIRGSFEMHFRDRVVKLNEGEFLIVPRGVEQKPVAENEVEIMLFEPRTTLHTGATQSELTINDQSWI